MTIQDSITRQRPAIPEVSGQLRVLHAGDAAEFESAFEPPGECIQLSAGRFYADVLALRANAVSVRSCVSNRGFLLRRWIGEEKVALAYINRGETVLEHGRQWSADLCMIVSGGDVDVSSLGPSDMTWIEIDLACLTQEERARLLRTTRGRSVLFSPERSAFSELRAYAAATLRMCTADPLLLPNDAACGGIESELLRRIRSLIATADEGTADVKRERKALVRRVERFMWENVEEPLTLQRICANTNCRMRSLIYSFKGWFGLGPITYLKILRLNGVHRRLRDMRGTDVRIFDIAADFGFWHMGHFSADYKRMFGVTASETVSGRVSAQRRRLEPAAR